MQNWPRGGFEYYSDYLSYEFYDGFNMFLYCFYYFIVWLFYIVLFIYKAPKVYMYDIGSCINWNNK